MHQHGWDDNVDSVCSLGFGLLFPAYGSFMAIESSGTEDDTQVQATSPLHAALLRSNVLRSCVAVVGILAAVLTTSRLRKVCVACAAMVIVVCIEQLCYLMLSGNSSSKLQDSSVR